MTKTIIYDLDGTLADIEHRRHLVTNGNAKWDEFYQQCIHDEPILPVINTFQIFKNANFYMVIFSGRSDAVRKETEHWLKEHNIVYDLLVMRPDGNYTPDEELKQEWLHTKVDKSNVSFVVDDRQKVVDMWRRNGLTCFQVAPGNF